MTAARDIAASCVMSCHDCGHPQTLPALPPGLVALCTCCGATLRQTWLHPLRIGTALSISSLVLFAAGATAPLATVQTVGIVRTATLFSGPDTLFEQGLWELTVLIYATSVVVPLLVSIATLYVLGGVRLRHPPPGLRMVFAWRNRLRPWAMIEVFLVGYFVALAKLGALVEISPGPGFFALFAFMVVTIATDAFLDEQAVWGEIDLRMPRQDTSAAEPATAVRAMLVCCPECRLACADPAPGAKCPRCGAALVARKHDSVARTAALAMSSLVLYLPANVFPALTLVRLGNGSGSTILGGVWELLEANELPLAAIVFVASVAIPVFKLLGLGVMLLLIWRRRGITHPRQLTTLYRFIHLIGRWSMIDIFMESILAGTVRFGSIARVDIGMGAVSFAAVVVLTMLAAESFDPRLLWDRSRA